LEYFGTPALGLGEILFFFDQIIEISPFQR
jgi:hypothetical protein